MDYFFSLILLFWCLLNLVCGYLLIAKTKLAIKAGTVQTQQYTIQKVKNPFLFSGVICFIWVVYAAMALSAILLLAETIRVGPQL